MLLSNLKTWLSEMSSRNRRVPRTPRQKRRRHFHPALPVEVCEARTLLTTFVVDSPLDIVDPSDGQTTLREAIELANANAGHDTVTFASHLGTTISLDTVLPTVIDPITIDGSSHSGITIDATGVSGNVLRISNGADGSLLRAFTVSNASDIAVTLINVSDCTIESLDLSPSGSAGGNRGLQISGSYNNTIRNVTASGLTTGIRLDHSSGNLLEGNIVSATSGSGIFIAGNSDINVVQNNDASGSQTGITYFGAGFGNQFVDNNLSETISYGLSIYRDTSFVVAGNSFDQSGGGLELRFMDSISLAPSPEFQLDVATVTGVGLGLVGVTNSSITGLNLSAPLGPASGTGLALTFGSHGNVVSDVTATNREQGVLLSAGADHNIIENSDFSGASQFAISLSGASSSNLIRNNDASHSQNGINAFVTGRGNHFIDNNLSDTLAWGMTVRNDSDFVSTGNTLSGSTNGVFLAFLDGVTLSPSETFDIDVSHVSGVGLSLLGVTNSTVADLDLSFDGNATGVGLSIRSSTGITATSLKVTGRSTGVDNNGSVDTLIHCSSILGNTTGVRVAGPSEGVVITDSQIEGNVTGIRNQSVPAVDATGNYWGAADGPSTLGGSGDSYFGNVAAGEFLTSLPACLIDVQQVDIDVKPGSVRNPVNVKSQGVIPVVIFTTAEFDASQINGSSVQLAGTDADRFALEDVDGDGDLDMILHFDTQAVIESLEVNLASGDSELITVVLTGETIDGVAIQGFDSIDFFRPGKGPRQN